MNPSKMTPEQAAAYVNGTCMVALSEMLSMHWENEQAKLNVAKGPVLKLPFPGQKFQDRIRMHCVTHENMLELFERAKG